MFMSNLLTHCSLDRDFFSTGSPSEPPGRSLSISSTYSDTGFDALAQSKGSKKNIHTLCKIAITSSFILLLYKHDCQIEVGR